MVTWWNQCRRFIISVFVWNVLESPGSIRTLWSFFSQWNSWKLFLQTDEWTFELLVIRTDWLLSYLKGQSVHVSCSSHRCALTKSCVVSQVCPGPLLWKLYTLAAVRKNHDTSHRSYDEDTHLHSSFSSDEHLFTWPVGLELNSLSELQRTSRDAQHHRWAQPSIKMMKIR